MSAGLDIAAERRIIEACDDPAGVLGFLGVYREQRMRAARRGQTALCGEIDDLIEFAEDHVVALKAERFRSETRRADRADTERTGSASARERAAAVGPEPAEEAGLAEPRPLGPRRALTLLRVARSARRSTVREPVEVDEVERVEEPATRQAISPARSVPNPERLSVRARAAEHAAARRAAEEAEAEGARADAELRELHARIARANARRDAALAQAARLDAAAKKAAVDAEQARRSAAAREAARAVTAAEGEADEAEAVVRRAAQPTVSAPAQAVALLGPTPAPQVRARDVAAPPSVASMFQARLAAIGREGAPVTPTGSMVPPPTAGLAPPPTLVHGAVSGDGAPARVPPICVSPPASVASLRAGATPSTRAEPPPPAGRPSAIEPGPPGALVPSVAPARAATCAPASSQVLIVPALPPSTTTPVGVPSPPAESAPYLLGADLTAFRQRLGVSQRALAVRLGVDQGAISRAEGRPTALLPPALHRALHGALSGAAAAP